MKENLIAYLAASNSKLNKKLKILKGNFLLKIIRNIILKMLNIITLHFPNFLKFFYNKNT